MTDAAEQITSEANSEQSTTTTETPVEQPAAVGEPVKTAPVPESGSFLDSLPEHYRQEPSLQKYKKQEDFLDGYLALERYKGNTISIPKEDATPEQRQEYLEKLKNHAPELIVKPGEENKDEFWSMMGTPENPDGYTLPEEMGDAMDGFKDIAHAAHLTNDQYNTVMKAVYETETQRAQEYQAQQKEAADALLNEWGAAYQDRYNQAYAAARAVGMDHEQFSQGVASPDTIRAYHKIYEMIGKEGKDLGLKEVISDRKTPDEINKRIGEIMDEMKGMHSSDPRYKPLLDEKRKLYQMKPENQGPVQPQYVDSASG